MSVAICSPLVPPFSEVKNQWSAWVPLLPGTHHIRFLVDNISTIAEDLPTTVDDNGSLANYVSVPFSAATTPTTSVHQTPKGQQLVVPPSGTGQSFFADAEAQGGQEDGAWTDKVPWQLECAAEEEEQWLNHSHSHAHNQHQIPPPQHPQAPSLPRHLEKLIMNQKPPTTRTSSKPGGSSTALFGGRDTLPVTTASGTNLSATTSAGSAGPRGRNTSSSARDGYIKLGDAPAGINAGLGLADDGSVLPVPNHVVLHHLGTSAIRNGVLAVADTLRYRKKVRTLNFCIVSTLYSDTVAYLSFSTSRQSTTSPHETLPSALVLADRRPTLGRLPACFLAFALTIFHLCIHLSLYIATSHPPSLGPLTTYGRLYPHSRTTLSPSQKPTSIAVSFASPSLSFPSYSHHPYILIVSSRLRLTIDAAPVLAFFLSVEEDRKTWLAALEECP